MVVVYILYYASNYRVVAATNPQAAGGSYSTPPLDGSRNGTFTANVFFPETKLVLSRNLIRK